jgi:hypothetical protein
VVQNTVRLLRVLTYVVAILVVAACGSTSTAARQSPPATTSPSASASPSASPGASPSVSPSASPLPTPQPITGGYGVLVTTGTADTYTVSLVGVGGGVVASATPSSPVQVSCGDAAAALLPLPVSTSDTRAYFLDAQGNVRFLTPNGETGVQFQVPSSGNTRSMFAVSADDSLIAVAVVSFTSTGATTKLYVDQLQLGGTQKLIFQETDAFTLWPIGWIGDGSLIVAKVPSCTQGGGPTCCGPQEYHVVNPANGARRNTVGGPTCIPVGAPSAAGTVCEDTAFAKANVLDWTGSTRKTLTIQGPTPAHLSPDGTEVALVVDGQTTFAGAKQTLDLVACGWIDGSHVIAGGDTQSQARVGDVTTGNIVPVAAQGVCAGRIPGGL